MRAPDAPIGWPSATAPPLTLTLSSSMPSARIEFSVTDANASLISHRSTSSAVMPTLSSAFFAAADGVFARYGKSSATCAWAMISPRTVLPFFSAHSLEASTSAPPPSLTPGELPAVCEPWSPESGLSFDSVSSDVSRRGASSISTTVSPLRPLTVTGTISSGRRPSSVALIASSWLRSAQRSMSARVISSSSATSPASSNICLPLNGLRRPSLTIASIALASPMRKPKRACLSRYGAWLIDSIPPPTPTSRSPARIAASRMPAARTPEAHTLLTVSEETSFGIPALICAWREGIWPWPAWRTWPMITCWTCSGSTFARSSAAVIAVAPRSVASRVDRPPPSFPIGVRAVPRITVLGMFEKVSCVSGRAPESMLRPLRVRASTDAPRDIAADTVAVGVFEGKDVAHDTSGGELQALLDSGEAKRSFKHLALAHADGKRWLVVGLGERDRFDGERARIAAATVAGRAGELGTRALCWEVPHHVGDEIAGALAEGTALAAYRFDRLKQAPEDQPARLEEVWVSAHHDVSGAVERAAVVAEAI